MSSMKKIIIAIAALTIAISIITANNLASVMLIMASRQGSAQVQTNGTADSGLTQNSGNTATTAAPVVNNTATTAAPAGDNTATTAAPAGDNTATTAAPAGDKTDAPAASGNASSWSKAETIEYFNKAVNGVKSGAKTVNQKEVTNYLAGATTISSGISSIYKMLGGDEWLDGMLKDNSQGAASYEGADITAKFPVEGQSWSSKLTEADVSSATCTEANGVYTIEIKTIADAKSDSVKVGEGHAPKAFNVILPGVVNDNIPGIAKKMVGTAAMDYPESTVKVTVDVATGHVLTAEYDLKWTINIDDMGIVLPFGSKSVYDIVW